MSRYAETSVWERARAKGSNLLVLLKIADWATDEGRDSFPSAKRLATATRMSERAVRYILHKLERDGEIIIELNTEGRSITIGKRMLQPEWFIHVRCVCEEPAYRDESAAYASAAFKPGRRRREQSAKFSDNAKSSNRQTLQPQPEKIAEKPENFAEQSEKFAHAYKEEILFSDPIRDPRTQDPAAPVAPATQFSSRHAFDRFWSEYPKRVGQDAAWGAWERLRITSTLSAQILASLSRQRTYLEREGGRYVPNPATWLNQGRWKDDPPPVRPAPMRPITASELQEAKRLLRDVWGRCRHDPRCENSQVCIGEIVRSWRRDRGEAA